MKSAEARQKGVRSAFTFGSGTLKIDTWLIIWRRIMP